MATGTAHPREGCDGIYLIPPGYLRKYFENKFSFAIARDELLVAYDEDTIDDEEFILLLKKPSFS